MLVYNHLVSVATNSGHAIWPRAPILCDSTISKNCTRRAVLLLIALAVVARQARIYETPYACVDVSVSVDSVFNETFTPQCFLTCVALVHSAIPYSCSKQMSLQTNS